MTIADASITSPAVELFERHRATLDGALAAIVSREYFSAYPESPKAYGEDGLQQGADSFRALVSSRFEIDGQPSTGAWLGSEHSPYGFDLEITYPQPNIDALLAATGRAIPAWRDAGVAPRTGVSLEILARLNAHSHEIAQAVMHTTGQAYAMAFQAGGPHAQDRGLEAVAYAYQAMSAVPAEAIWEKPQGKRPPLRLSKTFTVAPRGFSLLIGCNTFPTWNSYPGLFASLVTGNAVVVKPSPKAVLPLALTVAIARDVLTEAGFDPNLVTLAVDSDETPLAADLAVRPEIKIVDYTGSTSFGEWLESHARQAVVFTEKAGVNCVLIESTNKYRAMLANLAFTLSLYSGQMCTTTQNIYVERDGIETDEGHKSLADVSQDLAAELDALLSDTGRATAILGAIVNDGVLRRLDGVDQLGRVVLGSQAVEHPEYADAVIRTPALVEVAGDADEAAATEQFGPITLIVPTDSRDAAVHAFARTVRSHGAITAGVYSTDERFLAAVRQAALEVGVALSENLTGAIYVNQSAAFSDFHATGLNAAANASLTDLAFVTPRFHVVQSRRELAEQENI